MHQKQNQVANDIKSADDALNKLEFEAALYRHRYKKAVEKRDDWSAEYYSTKYQETIHKLNRIKKDLQKSLNLAKYIKV